MKQPSITDRERDMIMDIIKGDARLLPHIYNLRTIWVESGYDFPYMATLYYLRRQGLTGDLLAQFLQEKFAFGPVNAAAYFRKKVKSEFKLRPIYGNRQVNASK
jgi:hypothetical protein